MFTIPLFWLPTSGSMAFWLGSTPWCTDFLGEPVSRDPRYQSMWDVLVVLGLSDLWPNNADLSLGQLSSKLATPLCLISCKLMSDVQALELGACCFSPQGVTFSVSRCTKMSIRSVSYPAYPHNLNLCPVDCLWEYVHRTASLPDPSCQDLSISF